MLFAGQYEVKLERKKRILLPKMFLKSLEKQVFKGFFLFPSLQGNHIEACGEAWLAYWSRKMDEQGSILNKNEVLISNVLDHIIACEVDKSGRIILPAHFTEAYDIHQTLMVTGRGFRFQIWKKDEFLSYRNHMQSCFKDMYDMDVASQKLPAQPKEDVAVAEVAEEKPNETAEQPEPSNAQPSHKNKKKGRK